MPAFSRVVHAYSGLIAFVNQTLFRSAIFLFGFITLITVSCAGYVHHVQTQEEILAKAKRQLEAKNNGLGLELVRLQKQIQIDVVQVQQFLSDFSATRGQDGQDDGLANAAKFATQFASDIAAAKQAAEVFESPGLVAVFSDVERQFSKFYGEGIDMAKIYATQGTSAGNKVMLDFDKISDAMQEQLKRTETALDAARQRHSVEVAIAAKNVDEMRGYVGAVVSASFIATALTCLSGILIVGKWVVGPLGWITFCFKRLSGGETGYEVCEDTRRDEIGDLGRAYSDFRRVTIEQKKMSRETRLLAEFSEWLQCCKSIGETYQIIAEFLTVLIPNCSGSLYIYANSRDVLDCAATWNGGVKTPPMQPDECWGLRRGRAFIHGEHEVDFRCAHVDVSTSDDYCCVPILAHGETIGLLHFGFGVNEQFRSDELRRQAVADQYRIGVRCAEPISMAIANIKLRDQLHNQSIRDALTGLFNRRYLLETLRREFSRARRTQQPLSILSIDIDHFKIYNDNHGHDAGDTVLRAVGHCMEGAIRNEDVACRFGGEEFLIALPGAAPEIAARRAEDLRRKIEALEVHYLGAKLPKVTVSIGVAAFPICGDTPEDIIRAADAALYEAKGQDRNRVALSPKIKPASVIANGDAPALQRALDTVFEGDREIAALQ